MGDSQIAAAGPPSDWYAAVDVHAGRVWEAALGGATTAADALEVFLLAWLRLEQSVRGRPELDDAETRLLEEVHRHLPSEDSPGADDDRARFGGST